MSKVNHDLMPRTVDLPDIEDDLREEYDDLAVAAREALLIDAYRTGRVSLGWLADALALGPSAAEAWLADRGVDRPCDAADLEVDRADLRVIRIG